MRLIEVGGWHPHLPAAELSAVARRSLFQVARRVYVLPGDVDVARLAYSHRALAYVGAVQPGQRFLDPFCGTGALLIEAALIGAEAYGSDIDPVMVAGSRENLRYEALHGRLRRIDARRLAGWGTTFDAIATDIPYGRSASTHGSDAGELFQQLLVSAADVLRAGASAVVMAPAGLSLPEHHQFAVLARFRERASASLTRENWLLRKAGRR